MIMEMGLIDARVSDEHRLGSQAKANTLRDASKLSGDRGPNGPIKYPHCSKPVLPQRPCQSDQINAPPELRASMLKIYRLKYSGLCNEQILCIARWRSHKCDLTF